MPAPGRLAFSARLPAPPWRTCSCRGSSGVCDSLLRDYAVGWAPAVVVFLSLAGSCNRPAAPRLPPSLCFVRRPAMPWSCA